MSDRYEPPRPPEYDPYEGLMDLTGEEPLPALEDPALPPATPLLEALEQELPGSGKAAGHELDVGQVLEQVGDEAVAGIPFLQGFQASSAAVLNSFHKA